MQVLPKEGSQLASVTFTFLMDFKIVPFVQRPSLMTFFSLCEPQTLWQYEMQLEKYLKAVKTTKLNHLMKVAREHIGRSDTMGLECYGISIQKYKETS